jgi:hypothetical protein
MLLRQSHCERAQDERRQSAIGEHSGHLINHCVGDRRHHCGSLGVQFRPRVGRVDRARAMPALELANKSSAACPNKGDRYLRRLLTNGATAVMRRLSGKTDGHSA